MSRLRPRWETSAPFALLFCIGLTVVALPPYDQRPGEFSLAAVALLVVVALHLWTLRAPHPAWLLPVAPLGSFLVIALVRDASGGSSSGVGPLVAAPVFYLALYGSRRQLQVAAVLTGLTFTLPLLLVGQPQYDVSDLRRGAIWVAVAALIGPVVQQLVQQLQSESFKARQSEAQLRTLMDGAVLSSVISTDPEGIVTTFSAGAENLLGWRADEVVGRTTPAAFHDPDEIVEVARELGVEPGSAVFQTLAARCAPSRTWTFVRADGTRTSVRLVVTELRDAAGVLTGYLGVGIDNSETVRTRLALARAEERWRVVMDHLPDTTLIVTDADGRVDLISGAGAMREQIADKAGQPLSSVVSPANVEVLERLTRDALEGTSGVAELGSSRTGHEHEVQVVPLPHTDGPDQALILARDVSRERARERVIREAKERAERLFDAAPTAIVLHDLDGQITSANPAARRLLDRTRRTLEGSRLDALSVDPDTETVAGHLAALTAGGCGAATSEWALRVQDGSTLYLTLSSQVLHNDSSQDDLVLTHLVDMSDRRRFEQQLAFLADHDPLTGLANRRRFDSELKQHLDACARYGATGAVLMLDLDHFKEVNDTLGHAAGDELIVSLGALLREGVRRSDVVARLGGDEFALLLPHADRETATQAARSIVDRVRDSMAMRHDTRSKVTASVGVVMIDSGHTTPSDLMASVDLMMYGAKDAGRDRFVVLEQPQHT